MEYSLVFLALLFVIVFVEISAAGSLPHAVFSASSAPESRALSLVADETPSQASLLLVCTIDGGVHGIDPISGESRWSNSFGGSLVKSYNSVDMLKTGAVVPGDDGMLYIYSKDDTLQQYEISIPDLVAMSPIVQAIEGEGSLTIIGERTSSVISIDGRSGRLVMDSSMEANEEENIKEEAVPFSELINIGRVDYHVRAFDQVSKKEVWNFTYGQLEIPDSSFRVSESDRVGGIDGDRLTLNGLPVSAMFAGDLEKLDKAWSIRPLDVVVESKAPGPLQKQDSLIHLLDFESQEEQKQLYATANPLGLELSNYLSEEGLPRLPMGTNDLAPVFASALPNCPLDNPFEDYESLFLNSKSVCGSNLTGSYVVQPNVRPLPPEIATLPLEVDVTPWTVKLSTTGILALVVVYFIGRRTSEKSRPEKWLDDNTLQVGLLTVNMQDVKGRGCHGTVVYSGKLGKRPVAVKRMLASLYDVANKEVDLLIKSDGHPNVVRYFAEERCRDFIYLALELCTTTMDTAIASLAREGLNDNPSTVSFLKELTSAACHLHELRIVHCDIKPQNILVTERDASGSDLGTLWTPKLSDMGLGRKISEGSSSLGASLGAVSSHLNSSMQGAGTQGWRAPELLSRLSKAIGKTNDHDLANRCGRKVDVFSLGCVYFYTLSFGEHPFGGIYERENQILKGVPTQLAQIKGAVEGHHLIKRMISFHPKDRPSLKECLEHPFLWSDDRKIKLLCQLSDRLKLDQKGTHRLRRYVEKFSSKVVGKKGWFTALDQLFQKDILAGTHTYDYKSLGDLLRFIRNKYSHLQELRALDHGDVVSTSSKFLRHFTGPFPRLLISAYTAVLETCAHEVEFAALLGKEVVLRHAERSQEWQSSTPPEPSAVPCRSWSPRASDWVLQRGPTKKNNKQSKARGSKYKMALCTHWERTNGTWCAKGKQCGYAHGPFELRHKRLIRCDKESTTWRSPEVVKPPPGFEHVTRKPVVYG